VFLLVIIWLRSLAEPTPGRAWAADPAHFFGKKIEYRSISSAPARPHELPKPDLIESPPLARAAARRRPGPLADALAHPTAPARRRPRPLVPNQRPPQPRAAPAARPASCPSAAAPRSPSALLGPAAAFDGLRRRG
jgi:hypothetical protein